MNIFKSIWKEVIIFNDAVGPKQTIKENVLTVCMVGIAIVLSPYILIAAAIFACAQALKFIAHPHG